MSIKAQRRLLWIGLTFGLIYFLAMIFLLGFIPPPHADLDPASVAAIYTHGDLQFRVGTVVMLAVSGFWFPIALVITAQMVRHEKGFPMWAFMQGSASAVGVVFFIMPPMLWALAAFSAGRNPEITQVIHDFGWLTFFVPIGMFTFQLIPISIIAFTSEYDGKYSAFPRWLGYLTLFEIMSGELPVVTILFKDGPFSWPGVFAIWQVIFFFSVWVTALVFTLTRAMRHQEAHPSAG